MLESFGFEVLDWQLGDMLFLGFPVVKMAIGMAMTF
jgi:hypothetical protein